VRTHSIHSTGRHVNGVTSGALLLWSYPVHRFRLSHLRLRGA